MMSPQSLSVMEPIKLVAVLLEPREESGLVSWWEESGLVS